MKIEMQLLLVAAFATLSVAPSVAQQPQNGKPTPTVNAAQRWEHVTLVDCAERNELYAEFRRNQRQRLNTPELAGFELVSALEYNGPKPTNATYCVLFAFKRPK